MLNEEFTPGEIGELEAMARRRRELGNNAPSVLLELVERLEEEKKKNEMKKEPLSADWLEKLKQEKARKDQL